MKTNICRLRRKGPVHAARSIAQYVQRHIGKAQFLQARIHREPDFIGHETGKLLRHQLDAGDVAVNAHPQLVKAEIEQHLLRAIFRTTHACTDSSGFWGCAQSHRCPVPRICR